MLDLTQETGALGRQRKSTSRRLPYSDPSFVTFGDVRLSSPRINGLSGVGLSILSLTHRAYLLLHHFLIYRMVLNYAI